MEKNYVLNLRVFCMFLFFSCCCSIVSKISYKFVIKWSVSEEDFKASYRFSTTMRSTPSFYSSQENCLRETTFDFMDVENLTFSLCLIRRPYSSSTRFYVVLKSETLDLKRSDSLHLEYAYVATPYQIYSLESSSHFHFKTNHLTSKILNSESNGLFSNGYTIIYCQIHVKALAASSVLTQDNIKLQSYVQFNSSNNYKRCLPSHETCIIGTNFIDDFALCGNIPTFNVSLAKYFLESSRYIEKLKIKELTALSIEYLIEHLTCENVQSILKLAIKEKLLILKDACIRFIANECKILSSNQC